MGIVNFLQTAFLRKEVKQRGAPAGVPDDLQRVLTVDLAVEGHVSKEKERLLKRGGSVGGDKNVAKDGKDEYNLPGGETEYGGFDLTGVQVRKKIIDTNFDNELKPGGLRFMTSLSMDVVNQINKIKPNNIEYGYVAATREDWIEAHKSHNDKLQYVSKKANGKDTTDSTKPGNYFGFAKNVICTSNKTNTGGVVKEDHRNFKDYLLYTLVITYNDGTGYDKNVLARPYIRYTDANNLERVAYSEYRGESNTIGGCYTSYNAIVPKP